ncbi:MAG: hypothetical protein EPN85_12835 [Bacteroidetes bacterium]|nr:MAG: hypothetical protein EPN85_12835 [Bacteroidota bacterium]
MSATLGMSSPLPLGFPNAFPVLRSSSAEPVATAPVVLMPMFWQIADCRLKIVKQLLRWG